MKHFKSIVCLGILSVLSTACSLENAIYQHGVVTVAEAALPLVLASNDVDAACANAQQLGQMMGDAPHQTVWQLAVGLKGWCAQRKVYAIQTQRLWFEKNENNAAYSQNARIMEKRQMPKSAQIQWQSYQNIQHFKFNRQVHTQLAYFLGLLNGALAIQNDILSEQQLNLPQAELHHIEEQLKQFKAQELWGAPQVLLQLLQGMHLTVEEQHALMQNLYNQIAAQKQPVLLSQGVLLFFAMNGQQNDLIQQLLNDLQQNEVLKQTGLMQVTSKSNLDSDDNNTDAQSYQLINAFVLEQVQTMADQYAIQTTGAIVQSNGVIQKNTDKNDLKDLEKILP